MQKLQAGKKSVHMDSPAALNDHIFSIISKWSPDDRRILAAPCHGSEGDEVEQTGRANGGICPGRFDVLDQERAADPEACREKPRL